MQLASEPRQIKTGGGQVCLAIGMFDGVHLGHQKVISTAVGQARAEKHIALAITFDRHPNAVVAPERTPPLIYARSQKMRAIRQLGVDGLVELPFTPELSRQPPEAFIRGLMTDLGPIRSINVGSDFAFGHRRKGNVIFLEELGSTLQYQVNSIPPVFEAGELVSSTRIRELIKVGNFPAAGQLLGRPYTLAATVVEGNQLGRKLGYPTANLEITGLVLPPPGVYPVAVRSQYGVYDGAANLGFRPTIDQAGTELRLEVHLFDFDRDLYRQELEVGFLPQLRAEQRFATRGELQQQIANDADRAREVLRSSDPHVESLKSFLNRRD